VRSVSVPLPQDNHASGNLELGIVIVHYNTSEDLHRCLESIFAHPPACSFGVTVVDNASTDPGLAEVRTRFTGVDWILNRQNTGYAKGCNRGLAAHPAEWYLVLNPDIVVHPGALDALLACGRSHPRAGVIGPQLLNEDGTIQESCRRFYTLRTLLLRRTFLGRIFPRSEVVKRHLMRDFDHLSVQPVDWVLGGCILVSHRALERTGPMDERFFLYFEDVDWCYRMWQAGCEVLYTPDARFLHRHRRTSATGKLNRSFWLHLASLISFYEKWGLLVWLIKRWRDPLLMLMFWLTDLAALAGGFCLAYLVRRLGGPWFNQPLFPFAEYAPLLVYSLLLATVVFWSSGRYAAGALRAGRTVVADLQRAGTIFVLVLASTYLGHMDVISRAVLLIFLPILVVGVLGTRRFLQGIRQRLERGNLALERTLLAGSEVRIAGWLKDCGDLTGDGVDPVGYVCACPGSGTLPPLGNGRIPWLGRPAELPEVVRRYRASQVVIWSEADADPESLRLWGTLRGMGVRLRWMTEQAWLLAAGERAEVFGGALGVVRGSGQSRLFRSALRRLMDLAAGSVLAIPCGVLRLGERMRGDRGSRAVEKSVVLRDPWGRNPRVVIAYTADGRVRPLVRQWGLVQALLTGRITLWGTFSLADGLHWREPDPESKLAFWRGEPAPCALWGGPARDHDSGELGPWRRFWMRPGELETDIAAGSGENPDTGNNKVDEP